MVVTIIFILVQVGQEEGSPAKGAVSTVNQYSISLSGCELVPHDAFAMTKAAQCLTQLVRDSDEVVGAGINERNVESCIRCIRVFVEASLHSKVCVSMEKISSWFGWFVLRA